MEITTIDAKTMIDDARRYRKQEALLGKGGVFVLFHGEVQRWVPAGQGIAIAAFGTVAFYVSLTIALDVAARFIY